MIMEMIFNIDEFRIETNLTAEHINQKLLLRRPKRRLKRK